MPASRVIAVSNVGNGVEVDVTFDAPAAGPVTFLASRRPQDPNALPAPAARIGSAAWRVKVRDGITLRPTFRRLCYYIQAYDQSTLLDTYQENGNGVAATETAEWVCIGTSEDVLQQAEQAILDILNDNRQAINRGMEVYLKAARWPSGNPVRVAGIHSGLPYYEDGERYPQISLRTHNYQDDPYFAVPRSDYCPLQTTITCYIAHTNAVNWEPLSKALGMAVMDVLNQLQYVEIPLPSGLVLYECYALSGESTEVEDPEANCFVASFTIEFQSKLFLGREVLLEDIDVALVPTPARLVITGGAPRMNIPGFFYPHDASLVITGGPVAVVRTIMPGGARLTLTGGQPPKLLVGTFPTPGGASLVITGGSLVNAVSLGMRPGGASLVITPGRPLAGLVLTPGAGTLTLTGGGPVGRVAVARTPITTLIAVLGGGPGLRLALSETPGTAGLVLTGGTPAFGAGQVPGSASLRITGFSPATPLVSAILAPGGASLVITGGALPRLTLSLTPAGAALALTGGTAALDRGLRPGSASLVISPKVPFIAPTLRPTGATLTLTGGTGRLSRTFTPGGATLTITGGTFPTGLGLRPGAALLALTGGRPVNSFILVPLGATLNATGQPARIQYLLTPVSGVVTITGQQGGLSKNLTPGSASLVITGNRSGAGVTLAPGRALLTVTGGLGQLVNVRAPVSASLLLTAGTPSLAVTVRPFPAQVNLTGGIPLSKATLTPNSALVTVTGRTPAFGGGLQPARAALTLTGGTPNASVSKTPGSGTVTVLGGLPSTGGGFDPRALPGLILWARSDTGTWQDHARTVPATATSQWVWVWDDISGNGNHLYGATTESNHPLLNLNQINGLPSVDANFLGGGLQALFTLDAPFDYFMVVHQTGNNPGYTLVDDASTSVPGGGNFDIEFGSSPPTLLLNNGSTLGAANSDLAGLTWAILEAGLNTGGPALAAGPEAPEAQTTPAGGASYLQVNSNAPTTMGSAPSVARNGIIWGGASNNQTAEILLWNRLLTDAESAQVRNYLYIRYALGPLVKNLVAWWELEEASGTRVDSTGRGNDLAPTNTPTQVTGVAGGHGAGFDHTAIRYLGHADTADLSTGDVDWTFTGWFRWDTFSGAPRIVGKWQPASDQEWNLFVNSGNIQFQYADSTGATATNLDSGITVSASTSVWTFVVCGYDSVNDQVFVQVNHNPPVVAALVGGIKNGVGPFNIGGYNNGNNTLTGGVDQAGIWKRVLNQAEITYLYNNGAGRTLSEMVSAGPVWTPPSSPSLVSWMSSDTGLFQDSALTTPATADNDPVGGWQDRSGAGHHLIQATSTARPALKLAQVNGRPSVRFDGTSDYLRTLFSLPPPFSIYLVLREISWTEGDEVLGSATSDTFDVYQHNSSPNLYLYGGTGPIAGANPDLAIGTWGLVEFGVPAPAAGSIYLRVNNNSPITNAASTASSSQGFTLGANYSNTGFGNIEVAEVICYNRILIPSEQVSLRAYITGKYGFP